LRAFVAIMLAVVLAGACSSGHKKQQSPPAAQSIESGSATRRTRVLAIGSTVLQRAGSRGRITRETRHAVLASAQRYVDRAILAPLETGKAGRGYPALFVPGLRPAATGVDQRVLTDLAVGNTATLVETPSPVVLTGLADQSGVLLYLATKFSIELQVTTASGPMTIKRTVELTYEHVGHEWLVTAYRVTVTRARPQVKPAATGASRQSLSTGRGSRSSAAL
jgi:hypothetical protein